MGITRIFDFSAGQHQNTCPEKTGGLRLAEDAPSGEWVSPVMTTAQPFDWAVASWNGRGEMIEVQARIAVQGSWSPWFSFGRWTEAPGRRSLPVQRAAGVGTLEVDTLQLEAPASTWQMRILLEEAEVKRAFLATARAAPRERDQACPEAWGVDLPVPRRSQMVFAEEGRVWCSPTSLSMVMAYWGRPTSIPDEVVPGVYDASHQGHGNWSFNCAYAGSRGFTAYVDRFQYMADLERRIAAGLPVIASVSYQRAWLENAPIDLTGGHLLVVRGFTTTGDVIVNDPAAASDDGVRLVYPRDGFRRAWLDWGGVVYLVWPEGLSSTVQME